jgi:hypothetical protein
MGWGYKNMTATEPTTYVVSDMRRGYDKLRTPYWRPTAMMNSIVAAKAWANPNYSIITVHTFEEANEIMANRELPSDYRIVG